MVTHWMGNPYLQYFTGEKAYQDLSRRETEGEVRKSSYRKCFGGSKQETPSLLVLYAAQGVAGEVIGQGYRQSPFRVGRSGEGTHQSDELDVGP